MYRWYRRSFRRRSRFIYTDEKRRRRRRLENKREMEENGKKDILLDWKEGRKEKKRKKGKKRREFPSKRATVVFGSLERGSHDDLLYIAPNSNSKNLFSLFFFYTKQNTKKKSNTPSGLPQHVRTNGIIPSTRLTFRFHITYSHIDLLLLQWWHVRKHHHHHQ